MRPHGSGNADHITALKVVCSQFGANVEFSQNKGVSTYEILIDRTDFIRAIPRLQEKRLLNPDLTQSDINRRPLSTIAYGASFLSTMTVFFNYKNKRETGPMKLTTVLMDPDEYGICRSA